MVKANTADIVYTELFQFDKENAPIGPLQLAILGIMTLIMNRKKI